VLADDRRAQAEMARFLDGAMIARTWERLPGDVTPFHAQFSTTLVIVGGNREMRNGSGAYLRTSSWIYYDSESPRDYKDVNEDEMRCSLTPAVQRRYAGVPFPCGLRQRFAGQEQLSDAYKRTLEFYNRYHDLDADACELEYVRPAQTMARLNEGRRPITTFGIVDKTKDPITRAQLFGPEAA
jgi:hypothetical protein